MLYLELLQNEFNNQRQGFVEFDEIQKKDLSEYIRTLREVGGFSSEDVGQKIFHSENVGAIPSGELNDWDSFSIEFGTSWNNHEEARNWANKILQDRTTFAADGSQLYAEKETSLPVGAIQIGWFENPHNEDKKYEKNADFKIISPKELLENQEEPLKPENLVGQKRFNAEIDKAKEFLDKHKGWREKGEKMPVAFYDGTLLLSTPHPRSEVQEAFTNKLVELVNYSVLTKVPVIGYVDRSFSRDLLNFLDAFASRITSKKQTLYDATILSGETSNDEKFLKNWGDRTCFCYSKRKGLDTFIDAESERSIVGFSYLQTTGNSNPARVDVPTWVYEAGLLNEVLDVVRAECVIGLGSPYVLETADVTAVITNQDRQIFLGALQNFSKENNLNFSFSRKNSSKGRRR
ncbi:MAG: DNA double-strand break repair nuclease NurA [Aridibacter sp.]